MFEVGDKVVFSEKFKKIIDNGFYWWVAGLKRRKGQELE